MLAGAIAARESIGSQVACKLGLEHFVDGVLSYYSEIGDSAQGEGGEISLEVLEAAFRNANSSVYNFGHKLAAGGRLSASLLGVVLEDKTVAAGRVGEGVVYLFRNGELLPFFEEARILKAAESYIGSNSMVSVELASIAVNEGDCLIVVPQQLPAEKELLLRERLHNGVQNTQNPSAEICRCVYEDAFRVPFAMYARIGPETIYLAEAV